MSGSAIVSPSRIDSSTRWNMRSNTALLAVSLTMASDSRIGTPEAISVPSVRIVRATIVFSTRFPTIGIHKIILSSA